MLVQKVIKSMSYIHLSPQVNGHYCHSLFIRQLCRFDIDSLNTLHCHFSSASYLDASLFKYINLIILGWELFYFFRSLRLGF